MLESPVLSGMSRSAAAVALASKPTKWANQAIPGANNLTKTAPSDSDYRRAGAANQMVKLTVKESPPTGSDGDDIDLPFGSFMMMPFGDRDRFGLVLLTLI